MRDSEPFVLPLTFAKQPMQQLRRAVAELCDRYSLSALRLAIGVVFLWFGLLKFFPAASPAEAIAIRTLQELSLGLVPPGAALLGLALFETFIGLCFTFGIFPSLALPLLFLHMCGTALPFVLFPDETFNSAPFAPTFLGQYILKNLIIVGAGFVLLRRWR